MKDKWISLYNNWLKKNLSKDDRYILEKRALDDQFVADALEGIELYESRNTAILQEKLESKLLSKKKTKLITFWPYATAASLLLIASVFFLLQSPDEAEGSVVLNEEVLSVDNEEVIAYQEAPDESKIEMSDEPETSYKKTKESKPQVSQVNTAPEPDETVAKNSIGLQTRSLSYQSEDRHSSSAKQDHASISIQSSKELSIPENSNTTTQKQKVSAAMTVASNRSYDNMPVISSESSDNISNYRSSEAMIDIPNKVKIESENKSEIVLAPSQLEELNLDGQNSTIYDSVAEASKVQYSYHQAITEPKPKIGWEAFKLIVGKHMPTKDELFMRGIREGDQSTMTVRLDTMGYYEILEPGSIPTQYIEKMIKESGDWILPTNPDTLTYLYTIKSKSN